MQSAGPCTSQAGATAIRPSQQHRRAEEKLNNP